MDMIALLPELTPKATAWAIEQSREIQLHGQPLNALGLELAQRVGVSRPELVKILYVNELPIPTEPLLREVALQAGLLGPGMVGLTLGYGIFIVKGHADTRLVSHELRHVQQYEMLGGIDKFIPVYLAQIANIGYDNAPLEQDAREHEIVSA